MRYASDPLSQYIREYSTHPYELGRHDCVQFIAGWVARCMERPELADTWKGYRTKSGGLRRFGKRGQPLGEIVARELNALGWTPAESAGSGDILAEANFCAICGTPGVAIAITPGQSLSWLRINRPIASYTYE